MPACRSPACAANIAGAQHDTNNAPVSLDKPRAGDTVPGALAMTPWLTGNPGATLDCRTHNDGRQPRAMTSAPPLPHGDRHVQRVDHQSGVSPGVDGPAVAIPRRVLVCDDAGNPRMQAKVMRTETVREQTRKRRASESGQRLSTLLPRPRTLLPALSSKLMML